MNLNTSLLNYSRSTQSSLILKGDDNNESFLEKVNYEEAKEDFYFQPDSPATHSP